MDYYDSKTTNFILNEHRQMAVFEFVAHPEGLLIPTAKRWAPFAYGSNPGFEHHVTHGLTKNAAQGDIFY